MANEWWKMVRKLPRNPECAKCKGKGFYIEEWVSGHNGDYGESRLLCDCLGPKDRAYVEKLRDRLTKKYQIWYEPRWEVLDLLVRLEKKGKK
jgi:hypothetical protein